MNKEDLYNDFLLIKDMRAPTAKRARMLGELLSCHEDHWQVVGITKVALEVFESHDFKRVSHMGINRSHIIPRHQTYTTMIEGPNLSCDDWYDFYRANDQTILATSSENMSNGFSKIYPIDTSKGLFKSHGFSWKHKEPEISFLRSVAT